MAKGKLGFEVRNRPDWLYNSLPYSYVAIGLIVMVSFGLSSVIGTVSGAMFMAAGMVVFSMRRTYRRARAELRAELAMSQQRNAKEQASLLRLSWNKEYESGNPIIDEQHHRLFDLGNALLNAMLANRRSTDKPSPEIPFLLQSLLKHLQNHLATEEELLSSLNHPITVEHKTEHEHLFAIAKALVGKFRRGTLEYGDISEFVTYDLIARHIVTEDKQQFRPATRSVPGTPALDIHQSRAAVRV